MRKLILSTSILALLGLPAMAGGPVVIEPETEVVVERPTSSAAGIVVPLLLLVLIAAAASGGGSSDLPQESDRRIKTDLDWVGMSGGLPIWRYRYLGSPKRFEGVMAQDVQAMHPHAVVQRSNGVLAVRYDMLGLALREVA